MSFRERGGSPEVEWDSGLRRILNGCRWYRSGPGTRLSKSLAYDAPRLRSGQEQPSGEALVLSERTNPQGGCALRLRQSSIAAMTLGCWLTAMRCMRLSHLGQAMTSTSNTFRRSLDQGTQRRRMVLPLRDSL